MDARLSELLPQAMNVHNGDAQFIKNAGAVVSHPFGSTMRSILIAVHELGAEEICVIAHYDCGMSSINPDKTFARMEERGITSDIILTLGHAGIDLRSWFQRIESIPESVHDSVGMIRMHPLVPLWVKVHGLVMDPETGRLDLVIDGNDDASS